MIRLVRDGVCVPQLSPMECVDFMVEVFVNQYSRSRTTRLSLTVHIHALNSKIGCFFWIGIWKNNNWIFPSQFQ